MDQVLSSCISVYVLSVNSNLLAFLLHTHETMLINIVTISLAWAVPMPLCLLLSNEQSKTNDRGLFEILQ